MLTTRISTALKKDSKKLKIVGFMDNCLPSTLRALGHRGPGWVFFLYAGNTPLIVENNNYIFNERRVIGMITMLLLLTFVAAIAFVVLSIMVMLGACTFAVLLPVIDFVVFIWLVGFVAKVIGFFKKRKEEREWN